MLVDLEEGDFPRSFKVVPQPVQRMCGELRATRAKGVLAFKDDGSDHRSIEVGESAREDRQAIGSGCPNRLSKSYV